MFEQSTSDARQDEAEAEAPPRPANPHKVRLDFYHLAVDWLELRHNMPRPKHTQGRKAKRRESGHQSPWASDKAAQIAALFHDWHELVAEARNETPPPSTTTAEQTRIVAGWQYLEPRIEYLTTIVEAEALHEISELHHHIRRTIGYNNPPQRVSTPCNNCKSRTLLRHIRIGNSYVQCDNDECGWIMADDQYQAHRRFFARLFLDMILDGVA